MMKFWVNKYNDVLDELLSSFLTHEYPEEEIRKFEYYLHEICKGISNKLGGSLLEKVYQEVLYEELSDIFKSEYKIMMEHVIQINYNKRSIGSKRLDIVIYKHDSQEPFIILEIKNSTSDNGISQLNYYLELTRCRLGYIINFSAVACNKIITTQDIKYSVMSYTYDIIKLFDCEYEIVKKEEKKRIK